MADQGFQKMDPAALLTELQKPKETSLDMRMFDGQTRPVVTGTICSCKGSRLVLDADMLTHHCICTLENWAATCRAACGIPEEVLTRFTFDTFVEPLNPQAWVHRTVIKKYAEKDTGSSPWLVLYGDYGTGKTHLLIAMVGAMVDRGRHVIYGNALEMESQMRQAIDSNGVQDYVKRMATTPTLVIDDLGTEMNTPFVASTFLHILDQRHVNLRRTVLAFNKVGFGAMDGRLKSRILDMVVCNLMPFNGPDIRQTERG